MLNSMGSSMWNIVLFNIIASDVSGEIPTDTPSILPDALTDLPIVYFCIMFTILP